MSQVTQNVIRSMGEATAAAPRLIEKCVDQAVAQLQQSEAGSSGEQRQRIADAWRELLLRRNPWSTRFPRLLGAAFEAVAAGGPPAPAPAAVVDDGDDDLSLTLVDDTEIARTIESTRLAQQLTSMLERPLSELDALMSSALGLDGIQPERNPLRPAVYAQVLRDLMAEDEPQADWPALWLRHMTGPLAQELEQVYREQVHFLTLQRVHAASYRLRAAGGRAGSSAAAAAAAPAAEPSAVGPSAAEPWAAGPAANPGQLRAAAPASEADGSPEAPWTEVDAPRLQQFLLRGDARAEQPLTSSYYAQAEAELHSLQSLGDDGRAYDPHAARQHMHLPAVERPARRVDTESPLPQEVWGRYGAPRERALVHGRLKTQAREVAQVYGLEVVRRLVNRVADDPRLLAPVREAIVGLEPSLLRLAMVAPRFFSDAEHPGRLLVEGVAQRSFKYNDEFSVEFQGFFGPVTQAFQRLNEIDPLDDAEPFHAALAALQAGWAAQDALDEESHGRVLGAVQFADQRQQEADRIASEFSQRPDLAQVDGAVREFVLGTWSLVVAHARLTQPPGVDPGGYIAVVTDLLWSVNREFALHDPAHAFQLIPRVLAKLRAGVAMLGQQPQESEAFFRQLELLHRPVLKLRARQRHRDVAPPEPPPSVAAVAPARAPDEPWMAARELDGRGVRMARENALALRKGAATDEEVRKLREEFEKFRDENAKLRDRLEKLEVTRQ